jgi:hypothetical protein
MADSDLTLGNYVQGKEIILLDYNIRMVKISTTEMTKLFYPLGRAPDLGSFFMPN